MKISKDTFDVLQNFSTIYSGIEVDEPNCLKTMSKTGSIIAIYDTEETFEPFSIWDLTKFNNLVSVSGVENCDFEFKSDEGEFGRIIVKAGSRTFNYEYAESGVMPVFSEIKSSEKYKAFNNFDFHFDLKQEDIKELKRVNSILQFSEDVLKIEMKDDVGTLTIFSESNETTNTYQIEIDGEGTGISYLKVSDLNMIPGDYKASVCEQLVRFQHKTKPLTYFLRTVLLSK